MRVILILTLGLWLTGCASNRPFVDEPIIDRKGVDMSRYYTDKEECEAYADEVRTGEKVARGAVGGAVVGGAIGAIVNRGPDSAERGAGVGAVTGGVRGAQEGVRETERVVKQCLRGRGYRVLN
ncbi:MAG: glycine zipper family protein [Luminiphilus sp.]|nr:glycine zipper family protein [Luminiphilus sp.]